MKLNWNNKKKVENDDWMIKSYSIKGIPQSFRWAPWKIFMLYNEIASQCKDVEIIQ